MYILRDLLGLATTAKEARKILHDGRVEVDGIVRRYPDFPVGLMDVIKIPDMKKTYRVVPDKVLNLKVVEITKDITFKLCKITNKTILRGGIVQLNLHDGRNINIQENTYNVNDVVKITVKDQEIKDHIKLETGAYAIVYAGINNGRRGRIVEMIHEYGPHASRVTLDDEGEEFDTDLDFVMVLGDKKPVIEIPA